LIRPSRPTALLLAFALAVGCGQAPGASVGPTRALVEAVGIVTLVVGSSPDQVSSFTLRTPEGQYLMFELGERLMPGSFPPAHLRDHQASAQPVKVEYEVEAGRLVAFDLRDAP
jgi:hypothetical protein